MRSYISLTLPLNIKKYSKTTISIRKYACKNLNLFLENVSNRFKLFLVKNGCKIATLIK